MRFFIALVLTIVLLSLSTVVAAAAPKDTEKGKVTETFVSIAAVTLDQTICDPDTGECVHVHLFIQRVSPDVEEYLVCVEIQTFAEDPRPDFPIPPTGIEYGCTSVTGGGFFIANDLSSATLAPTVVDVCDVFTEGEACREVTISATFTPTGEVETTRIKTQIKTDNGCKITERTVFEQLVATAVVTINGVTLEFDAEQPFPATFIERSTTQSTMIHCG